MTENQPSFSIGFGAGQYFYCCALLSPIRGGEGGGGNKAGKTEIAVKYAMNANDDDDDDDGGLVQRAAAINKICEAAPK